MATATTSLAVQPEAAVGNLIERLRALALRGLARMYRPDERLFAFRLRRVGDEIRLKGSSIRYTAIVAIGLAGEPEAAVQEVLAGERLDDLVDRLLALSDTADVTNLGDLAVVYWAARVTEHRQTDAVLRHIADLVRQMDSHATVHLAWALAALCEGETADEVTALRDEVAQRLLGGYEQRSGFFTHDAGSRRIGLRGHVACFADLIYPIHALARYHAVTSDRGALTAANRCADQLCGLFGPAGQWWWHYDVRTGRVIERYPVYAVHQDAMAPMALFALAEAGGDDHSEAIEKGLAWLMTAPELDGRSLIDGASHVIWRKVGRREPRKLVRSAQAAAARVHPRLRWPAVDLLFPAGAVDYECRPYHLGWLLYAWPEHRARCTSIGADTTHAAAR